ncbi:MAG: hypothetical protein JNJ63_05945 [Hyphomonadaceae bacterium]|nr:hypothetical protein [Hyphomonadaceae bacterium]
MIRKLMSAAAAFAFAATTLAPVPAAAHDRRDGYYDHRYDRHYDRRDRRRDHDDNDALAAGAVGLVLGLALGSLASQSNEPPRYSCSDDYQRCAPPPRYYDEGGYDDKGYDPYYDGRYDDPAPQCTRRERQWDRYAQRELWVDVPC